MAPHFIETIISTPLRRLGLASINVYMGTVSGSALSVSSVLGSNLEHPSSSQYLRSSVHYSYSHNETPLQFGPPSAPNGKPLQQHSPSFFKYPPVFLQCKVLVKSLYMPRVRSVFREEGHEYSRV